MKQKYYWIAGIFIVVGVFLVVLILSNVGKPSPKDLGKGSLEIVFRDSRTLSLSGFSNLRKSL